MNSNDFELSGFIPYQLATLQTSISQCIAKVYQGEFNLSRQEWRVIAILATHSTLNAKQIGQLADLDKMPTSRAIKKLITQNLVHKCEDNVDKRAYQLSLTSQGQALFNELSPLVKQQEQVLLSVLETKEKEVLNRVIEKLLQQSKDMQEP